MIKNIIFDLGNVIIQCTNIETMMNFTRSEKVAQNLIKYINKSEEWKLLDLGNIDKEEAIIRIQKKVPEEYKKLIKKVMEERPKYIKFNTDTIKLAQNLKRNGYDLFVLSNMASYTYETIKSNEFFDLCKGKVISAYEHIKKPNEEIFKKLIDRYKLDPEECLFIDDDDTGKSLEIANKIGIKGRRVLPNNTEDVINLLKEYNINYKEK